MAIVIPPIKSQGIKTKLVPWINDLVLSSGVSLNARWIEPFFGTGVVGFNSPLKGEHIVGDTNPHIINFYKQVQCGIINPYNLRAFLEQESKLLETADEEGYAYYRIVRQRFNDKHNPYDFIFLSRAGFNGMMRFNRRGAWNIPFCKKPNRFAPAYITKICNQVKGVAQIMKRKPWVFHQSSFLDTIALATENDIIYCDPPYYGRYTDYYNGWTEDDEAALYDALLHTPAKFILSTWHHSNYRVNDMMKRFWNKFNIMTKEHFYHNGGKLNNRNSIVEAMVYNFDIQKRNEHSDSCQLRLFTIDE